MQAHAQSFSRAYSLPHMDLACSTLCWSAHHRCLWLSRVLGWRRRIAVVGRLLLLLLPSALDLVQRLESFVFDLLQEMASHVGPEDKGNRYTDR